MNIFILENYLFMKSVIAPAQNTNTSKTKPISAGLGMWSSSEVGSSLIPGGSFGLGEDIPTTGVIIESHEKQNKK